MCNTWNTVWHLINKNLSHPMEYPQYYLMCTIIIHVLPLNFNEMGNKQRSCSQGSMKLAQGFPPLLGPLCNYYFPSFPLGGFPDTGIPLPPQASVTVNLLCAAQNTTAGLWQEVEGRDLDKMWQALPIQFISLTGCKSRRLEPISGQQERVTYKHLYSLWSGI